MARACDFLWERFVAAGEKPAFIETDGTAVSYAEFLDQIAQREAKVAKLSLGGAAVQLCGDFSAGAAAWLLALWRAGAVVAPLAPSSTEKQSEFATVADVSWIIDAATDEVVQGPGSSVHPLYDQLRHADAPGLVIFTSGTSGVSKGAVHDVSRLMGKFYGGGKDHSTLGFLLFDHIAGIDTLLYCLANASTLVCLPDRSPDTVVARINAHDVEVLPTAPSFLNMLLLSRPSGSLHLPSLRVITYGAEMMPQGLLERVADAFPGVRLVQKYGASELGALRSRSESERSRWISLEADWRVVDGMLEIKTSTAMIGYLNAPAPFTTDGWFKTGDRVETRGQEIRFLGRDGDIINVGGQKVFPAEVENALAAIEGVAEAAVYGRPHPMLGQCVCANVRLHMQGSDPSKIRVGIRKALAGQLEPYKIPQRIDITDEPLVTARFKQKRTH